MNWTTKNERWKSLRESFGLLRLNFSNILSGKQFWIRRVAGRFWSMMLRYIFLHDTFPRLCPLVAEKFYVIYIYSMIVFESKNWALTTSKRQFSICKSRRSQIIWDAKNWVESLSQFASGRLSWERISSWKCFRVIRPLSSTQWWCKSLNFDRKLKIERGRQKFTRQRPALLESHIALHENLKNLHLVWVSTGGGKIKLRHVLHIEKCPGSYPLVVLYCREMARTTNWQ